MIDRRVRISALANFQGLLGVLFIGLKLTDYIDWGWVWVTIPIWGTLISEMLFENLLSQREQRERRIDDLERERLKKWTNQ